MTWRATQYIIVFIILFLFKTYIGFEEAILLALSYIAVDTKYEKKER